MKASIFNLIEQKIVNLSVEFDNKSKPDLICYKTSEPTDTEFLGKIMWAQKY